LHGNRDEFADTVLKAISLLVQLGGGAHIS
jgi:hypothetical protein